MREGALPIPVEGTTRVWGSMHQRMAIQLQCESGVHAVCEDTRTTRMAHVV